MKNSSFRSIYASTNRRSDATPTAAQEQAERKVTLDEMQEMGSNGKLEKFLDALGIPTSPGAVNETVKRRMGEGTSFDRETFNQAAYDKRLLKGNK